MFPLAHSSEAPQTVNLNYAAALRRAADVIASAPVPPRWLEFTSAISGDDNGGMLGRILVTWVSGAQTLQMEFDGDGPVDYWSRPDFGPLPGADGDLLGSIFGWLQDELKSSPAITEECTGSLSAVP